jgi:Ran GTPase-activating protein (RanGAP) involved in mRNA processing and transport
LTLLQFILSLGAIIISDAIKRSGTLGMIDLSLNHISEVGAKAIGDALSVNKSLHSLYLTNNGERNIFLIF